jgi:hypothetical protein
MEAHVQNAPLCIHCGQQHPVGSTFCPSTGRPIPLAPVQPPPQQGYAPPPQQGYAPPPQQGYAPPQGQPGYYAAPYPGSSATAGTLAPKPIGALLGEAFGFYTKHLVALLLTCAVLFAPTAAVSVVANWAITAPLSVGTGVANAELEHLKAKQEALQKEMARTTDPKRRAELAAEQVRLARETLQAAAAGVGAVAGGLMLTLLMMLAWVAFSVIFFGLVMPLTNGAMTVAVADGVTGNPVSPGRAWSGMFRRLGKLLLAGLLSGLAVGIGLCLCVLPGLVIGFFLAFVAPVVVVEGKTGVAALQRSVELVKFDWLYALIVFFIVAAVVGVGHVVGGVIFAGDVLLRGILSQAVSMLLYPIGAITTVLTYFEIRRRKEGLSPAQLRAALLA